MSQTSQAIMIKATIDQQDINICRFNVDRPVHSGTAVFNSKAEAQGNELARKIFDLADIKRVEFADNLVTVTKDSADDWALLARRVGGAIRLHLNPEAANALPPDVLKKKVQEVLDMQVNPNLAAHGGFVELINVENNNVFVRMGGGCQGCGAADVTLKMGIERMIREAVPSIGAVYDTTDHAGGTNPYYSAAK